MNKIALFTVTPRSATALLIAATTNCPITHAAIEVDGIWYHASESTGKFSEVDLSKMTGRHCAVYLVDGELTDWVRQMTGKLYDWKGIFGWGMKLIGFNQYAKGNPKKFYCFEAALDAIRHSGCYQLSAHDKPVSGCDIANLFYQSLGFGKFERFI